MDTRGAFTDVRAGAHLGHATGQRRHRESVVTATVVATVAAACREPAGVTEDDSRDTLRPNATWPIALDTRLGE